MKFCIKNLGPLRDASIELGKLTVICGKNNCGKTYIAYTLDTFLDTTKYNLRVPLHPADLSALFEKGSVQVNLKNYVEDYIKMVQITVPKFTETLPRFLAMSRERFENTRITVPLEKEDVLASLEDCDAVQQREVDLIAQLSNVSSLAIRRFSSPLMVKISLLNTAPKLPPRRIVQAVLGIQLAHLFNSSPSSPLFPESFIITSERTGAALFRSDLMGVKVRKDQSQTKLQVPTGYKGYGYQRPVEKDIEFVLELKRFLPQRSFIAEEHPDILHFFSTIAGGTYTLDETLDQVLFKPRMADCALSLAESSSTVRALAELHFYLKHMAQRGQVLMFDEPEINLHPENQRKLARLFAMLVNAGLRVFITTHSDYIVREINALLRMEALGKRKALLLARKHGYFRGEGLSPEAVKIFILHDGVTEEVDFNPKQHAFGVPTFDDTIEQFNALYADLMDWGV